MPDKNPDKHEFPFSRALKLFTAKLVIVGLVLVFVLILWFAVDIPLLFFAGVVLAVFIRSMSIPLARLTRMPHALAVFLVVVVLFGIVWLLANYLAPHVGEQLDVLKRQLPEAVNNLQAQFRSTAFGNLVLSKIPSVGQLLSSSGVAGKVAKAFTVTLSVVSDLFIFLIAGVYLTFNPDIYILGIVRLVPKQSEGRARELFDDMAISMRRWIIGTLASMATVGFLTGIGLWLLGIPLALTLALISGLLTFIPYLGAIVSAVPAMLLAILIKPVAVLWVACLYLGAHTVEAYFVTPLVQQHQVHIPPVFTLFIQILFAYWAGFLGLLLATPIMAALFVLVKILYIEDILGKRADIPGREERKRAA